jgi:hypothetical protein
MRKKAPEKPRCVGCGKTYGERNTEDKSAFYNEGEAPPSCPTNHIITRTNDQTWGSQFEERGKGPSTTLVKVADARRRITWTIWDGTYRTPYRPFCTLRCALAFARRAAKERGLS